MDLNRYKEPPKFICPVCAKNIESPQVRLRCLTSPQGFVCPCEKKVRLRIDSNYWFALIIGCALLLIGGRLWSAQVIIIVPLLFLAAGTAALLWGVYNSSLHVVETKQPASHSAPGKR